MPIRGHMRVALATAAASAAFIAGLTAPASTAQSASVAGVPPTSTPAGVVAAATAQTASLVAAYRSRAASISKKFPTYRVSPSSKPTKKGYLKAGFINSSANNKYTKHYFLLRTYLERLEKKGGGTLVLRKGTYRVPNTLYVPSNVTIRLEAGARLLKTTKSGTSKLKPSASLFHTVGQSVANSLKTKKPKRYGGYDGETNISFVGERGAVIDLGYHAGSHGIVAAHTTNLTITGLTFMHSKGGHFVELDASKNALITGNRFTKSKASSCGCKEAINLDTPDKSTGGLNVGWTKYDKTPDHNVSVTGNTFSRVEAAVGTHSFSMYRKGSGWTPAYHTSIRVTGNTITKSLGKYALHVEQWKDSLIDGNTVTKVKKHGGNAWGVFVMGSRNLTISDNRFSHVETAIQYRVNKQTGAAAKYGYARNYVTHANFDAWLTNRLAHTTERFVRWNLTSSTTSNTVKINLPCDAGCGISAGQRYSQGYPSALID